jgi:hypothetical protein
MRLSDAQLRQYHEDGFVIVRDFLYDAGRVILGMATVLDIRRDLYRQTGRNDDVRAL